MEALIPTLNFSARGGATGLDEYQPPAQCHFVRVGPNTDVQRSFVDPRNRTPLHAGGPLIPCELVTRDDLDRNTNDPSRNRCSRIWFYLIVAPASWPEA